MLYKLNKLEKKILEISYKYQLSHLSSNLSAVNIIDEIYNIKKEDEPFILSCGHSFLALAIVLQKYHKLDAEQLFLENGTHPTRNIQNKIYYSTGSLGCGISAACGISLSDRTKNCYCLISDGESLEGSIWESLNLKTKYNIQNLKVYVNLNGFSALEPINIKELSLKLKILDKDIQIRNTNYIYKKFPFLNGVDGHYCTINLENWIKINKNKELNKNA